jgi:hypothetical protein
MNEVLNTNSHGKRKKEQPKEGRKEGRWETHLLDL